MFGGIKSPKTNGPEPAKAPSVQQGKATYYASKFAGRLTALGEHMNLRAFTAAHKTLPFNTLIEVTNLNNMKSVIVRINDRGPFVKGRIVDLSHAAAEAIGFMGKGMTNVSLRVISKGQKLADNAFAPAELPVALLKP